MIATNKLPNKYINWNKTWGAPYGYRYNYIMVRIKAILIKIFFNRLNITLIKLTLIKFFGMFAFQLNNNTREYEYPWAYFATPLKKGMNVIDIGGGISGFQFMLSKEGVNVVNVDPSDKEYGWIYDQDVFSLFNKVFGTNVTLIQEYLDKANLKSHSYDRVYCISVLEHLTTNERQEIMKEVYRVLKTGGYFVITLDLFLDIFPFFDIKRNEWGSNMNAAEFIEGSGFKLVQGNKEELLGFPEFKAKNVKQNVNNYLMGKTYPVLTQTFVLQKN